MSVRISWDELAESPKKAEQMFDLLMHAEYGNRVRTINGSGGDGGRDAWIEDIRRAVEFKSWTKLGKSQRAQVVRSLKRASEEDIASWVLVAPVHATPGELQWFNSLKGRYRNSFEMQLLDVRWLESKLAERPDIARYMMTTPHQEVVDMLRELHQEQAGLLGGVPDLAKRLNVLSARADELSPIWGLDFSTRGGQNSVFVRLKPGVPPQRIEVHLDTVEDDPAGSALTEAMSDALHYGAGTVIEPGSITRVDNEAITSLNLPWEQVAMVLPDQRVTAGFPRAASLRPRDSDGTKGRPLHLTLHYATEGSRGMYVHGTDTTGMLRLRVRIDRPGSEQNSDVGILLQYGSDDVQHPDAVDPEALLRTVTLLDSLDHAPGMVLTLGTEQIDLDAQPHEPTGHFAPIARALRDFILVRDELDVALPLPARWSRQDDRNIALLAGLLRGDEVAMPLSSTVCHQISTADEARQYMDLLERGHGGRIDFEMVGLALPVGEVQIPVDPLYVAFSRARITNAAEVTQAIASQAGAIPVDISPAAGSLVLGRRTPFPAPGADDGPATHSP
ncbi:hypothetical protein NQK81_02555 [Amycolatopsis roodepoortensis]|uniref:hypothetical protein n=1 Tax=Amycolatopsis roodepoortensis TaxID=700274 RepID=UPI00214CFACF|nr:hypothetical protein [Amycolatopsis roodepoortensis]UUV32355.1 hypothetical protein NQK81_02555 [Amycolatopsis roodepoortensis]